MQRWSPSQRSSVAILGELITPAETQALLGCAVHPCGGTAQVLGAFRI